MKRYFSLIFILWLLGINVFSQQIDVSVDWRSSLSYTISDTETVKILYFENCSGHNTFESLPVWQKIITPSKEFDGYTVKAEVSNMIFEPLPLDDYDAIDLEKIEDDIIVKSYFNPQSGALKVFVLPLKNNIYTGTIDRLSSFTVSLVKNGIAPMPEKSESGFVENSRLSSGNWYKIYVSEDGMHQLSVSDLETLGLPVTSLDPTTLKIYGNGGGLVPESNSDVRLDDLNEIAISVSGTNDGRFNGTDKITFYGEGPHKWSYNPVNKIFEQEVNIYATKNCYYITYGGEKGKRIASRPQSTETPTNVVTTVDYYANHELEENHPGGSGREWLGELFDIETDYTFSFDMKDPVISSPVNLYAVVAASSSYSSRFNVSIDGTSYSTTVSAISSGVGAPLLSTSSIKGSYYLTGTNLDVKVSYVKPVSSAKGWLDRIRINARRYLKFHGGQMPFCDSESAYYGHIAEYVIDNAGSAVKVYDVSDHQNVTLLDVTAQNNEVRFVADAGVLYNYLAVDGDFLTPELGKKVANQNLHAHQPVNMVIVTHPTFSEQANKLADFHNNRGLTTRVVNVFEIYNEFSCGTQDIGAIRDYLRMLYDRSSGESGLKYLLLFGDASYDYLNREPVNENFIPTWESPNSDGGNSSYATDDFYGILEAWEGKGTVDDVDIGIGRLVVSDTEEADMAINKIFDYSNPRPEIMGDWRNNITIVADDEDDNLHVTQADNHSEFVNSVAPEYNINKVFLDAYTQVSAAGGERFPDANEAINTSMAKGNLIVNYVGHGGELGWALERVVELSDINAWSNYDRMPLFITATCEFARFDDPERVSAGEQVFMNPDGGGVALITSSRPTYAGPNFTFNHSILANAFVKDNGVYPRLGDLIRIAKIAAGSTMNTKKFILIGDPALQLAYPQLHVETTHFNDNPVSENDTIKALDFVSISGRVFDDNGQTDHSFNGIVYPTVYDKPSEMVTLGTDPKSQPFEFEQQNRILYRGQADVVDGEFSFSFQVPKDINYSYDFGKISYYVSDGYVDGHGYDNHFIVGGFSDETQDDAIGPDIELFINDEYFINGGITSPDPELYAEVYDESGINVGTGIGHDITAILDGDSDNIYVLNEFYQGKLNSYKSGIIEYPFFNLTPGKHTLEVKVWDALNNSSTATISFVVADENAVLLANLNCYPNPFSESTQLFFEHNQAGEMLSMDYMIFDLSGRLVYYKTVEEEVQGSRTSSITWNGTDLNGSFLPGGVYICKLIVTNEESVSSVINGKFVLTR